VVQFGQRIWRRIRVVFFKDRRDAQRAVTRIDTPTFQRMPATWSFAVRNVCSGMLGGHLKPAKAEFDAAGSCRADRDS
jgi:hypothetical protein